MTFPDDPSFFEYLVATGNADLLDRDCDCVSCRMLVEGFARWRQDREYESKHPTTEHKP